jgi:hypothetical protein
MLGDFTFMKIQRTIAVLWIGVFIAVPCYWLWAFLNKSAPAYDGIHALESPLLLFGIVASIFLFKGANWARISMGCLAIVFAVGVLIWEILPQRWWRADKWADDAVFVLSLVTIGLFFRRYEPAAKQIAPKSD